MLEFLASNLQNHLSLIFSYQVQMQISQDWNCKNAIAEGVFYSEKQGASHEIVFRSVGLKTDTQEHWEDRKWILFP